MKAFLCFAAVLAVVNVVCGTVPEPIAPTRTSSEALLDDVKLDMIKNYMRERQAMATLRDSTEKICPGYGDRFEKAISKIQQCTETIDENTETMCSAVKNHFERCIDPIVSIFEECLPERSKDLPSFIIKSTMAVSQHLCKTDGEHIFEARTTAPKDCIRRIQTKLEQFERKIPTREDVCQVIGSFRGCLQSHLQASCGNTITREAFLNVYDAIIDLCQKAPKRIYKRH
ncbi:hypothetical protein NQ317_013893 [Molorchus minor]|uniref:Uncharacterized protein n=1 Tax=Molorchus minor TaxID=1323400 RepID=A0ABQ9K7A1_9CUCU|nr:hypothetical protein NQ317_013893 [Molorchus minor]